MTPNTELYEKLLEKYRVSAPLPEKKKNEVLARKRNLYKKLMKRTGAYGMAIAVISCLFFLLRKKGIRISFIKSAVITATAAALLALTAAGGLSSLIRWMKAPGMNKIEEIEKEEKEETHSVTQIHEKDADKSGRVVPEQRKISQNDRQTFNVKKQTIRYYPLKAGKDRSKQAALLTGKIIDHLKKQNKNLDIIPAVSKPGGASGIILIGSLEPDGKGYTVNTKLVDVKSTKVLFMNYYTIPLNGDLEKSAETIAKSLSGMLLKIQKRKERD